MRSQDCYSNPAFVGDTEINSVEFRGISKDQKYNPYEHRKVSHPTNNAETLFHLLKCSLGTGILAMPNAFKNSGYLAGTIGTIAAGVICTYCVHLLVNAEYELCRRKKLPSLTYTGVAEIAMDEGPIFFQKLKPYIGAIVNIFILICQLGCGCIYVVFVASNIKSIADYYMDPEMDVRHFMLIMWMPLIFLGYVRNLKYLAPFSTCANGVTLISFGCICYFIFRGPMTLNNKIAIGTPSGFSLFFSTVLFALEAIGSILPLENEMKTPQKFGGKCGVFNIAMIITVSLFVGMGLFGYLRFGNEVKGSITLSLPAENVLAQCVKGMLAFAIFINHGVACFIAFHIIWKEYVEKRLGPQRNKIVWEYSVRTAVTTSTFLLAVAIPNLELFISLFGALALSALGLIFPAIIHIATYWYYVEGFRKVWLFTSSFVLIVIGLFGLVVGTYVALVEIGETFFN